MDVCVFLGFSFLVILENFGAKLYVIPEFSE